MSNNTSRFYCGVLFFLSLSFLFFASYSLFVIFFSTLIIFFTKRDYVSLAIVSFLPSLLLISLDYYSDTVKYHDIFMAIDSGSFVNNEGFEYGYVLYNKVISLFTSNFDVFLMLNYFFCNFTFLVVLKKLNAKLYHYFIAVVIINSPNYLINISLLIRNALAIAFFLWSLVFYSSRMRKVAILSFIVSLSFHLSMFYFFAVFFSVSSLVLKRRIIIFFMFLYFAVYLGLFSAFDIFYYLINGLSGFSSYLSRKALLIYELGDVVSIYEISKYLLILISVLFIGRQRIVESGPMLKLLFISFTLMSLIICLAPYGSVIVVRLGLLGYLYFFLFVTACGALIDSCGVGAKICYFVMLVISFSIPVYSYFYYSIEYAGSGNIASGDFLIRSLFDMMRYK